MISKILWLVIFQLSNWNFQIRIVAFVPRLFYKNWANIFVFSTIFRLILPRFLVILLSFFRFFVWQMNVSWWPVSNFFFFTGATSRALLLSLKTRTHRRVIGFQCPAPLLRLDYICQRKIQYRYFYWEKIEWARRRRQESLLKYYVGIDIVNESILHK